MLVPIWMLAAQAVGAAVPDGASTEPQEIIVTGERVSRSLRETPSSVEVVTERELEAGSADRVEQLLAAIPNVRVADGSKGPTIRGQDTTGVLNNLDAFLGGTRPRATMEVDGRALGFQEFVFGSSGLWDVKQVEVFRSPMTVTHGRNSIAGGIVVTTNDPTYDWETAGRLIAGDFDTREASAVVSGPVAGEELAFRLAGDIRHSRTTTDLAKVQRGADPNDDNHSLLRFKLLAEPKAVPDLRVVATATHSYSRAPQDVLTQKPFRKREWPFGQYGIFGVDVSALTVHATQRLGSATIDGVVSAGHTKTRRYAEIGRGESRARLNDLSGEIYGSWEASDWLTLRGGVHALDSRFKQHIDLSEFIGSIGDFRDHQRSFGMFGEAEVAVGPRLSVSAGGRYQHDRQRRFGALVGDIAVPVDFDFRFSAFLPRLSASYALSNRLKAGVLVQRAYNPGGAAIAFDTGELDAFRPEYLWDYEAFLKGELGSNVSIAANLFYNDMRDAQRGVVIPITLPNGEPDFIFRFNNVAKAWTKGAEVALNWRPSRTLELTGAVGLLRTRLDADVNSDGDVIGKTFERSPKFSASAAVDWSPVKPLRLSAQLRHHSRYYSDDFNFPELRVGAGTIVNARGSYDFGPVTAFAYARNLFDRLQPNVLFTEDVASLEDPRVIGFGLEARF